MKSRTSYSKLTVFRKDITRFVPLWLIYTIGLLLVFQSIVSSYSTQNGYAAEELAESIGPMGVANMLYAALCAVTIFGDLYNTRLCNALHAMPQRRESLFLSHVASGLSFALAPYALIALVFLTQLGSYWYVALYWLLAMALEYMFFFGVAVFSVFLTGQRFAMLMVYAVINALSVLVYWFLDTIFLPQMYGVQLEVDGFLPFCPVAGMIQQGDYLLFALVEGVKDSYVWEFQGVSEGWKYLGILGAIGLALLGLSVLLYRWRHLERAGDFAAFRALSPVVCVLLTLVCGAVLSMIAELFFGLNYLIWLIVGMVIGFFGSLMLLSRTVKVFRPRNFLWMGVFAAAMGVCFLLVITDAFGIVRWVPQAEEVKGVSVYRSYYEYYYRDDSIVAFQDEADIQTILDLHQSLVDTGCPEDSEVEQVYLVYTLENGSTVTRRYYVDTGSEAYQLLKSLLCTPELVLGYSDWDEYVSSVTIIDLETYDDYGYLFCGIDPADYPALLEALREDCSEGTVYRQGYYQFAEDSGSVLWLYITSGKYSKTLVVTEAAKNTLQAVKELCLLSKGVLGYTDWDAYVAEVQEIVVTGVTAEEWTQTVSGEEEISSLLEAIRRDLDEFAGISESDYDWSLTVAYIEMGDVQLAIPTNAANTITWLNSHMA